MITKNYIVPDDLSPFINCVMTGESDDDFSHTNIPLYADGYPGIMFQQSENGFFLLPKNKRLSELYLYGQTLEPISLDVNGRHRWIVIQLYPFASKYLLNIDPRALNDDCYDLLQIKYIDVESFRRKLVTATQEKVLIDIIFELMRQLIAKHQVQKNDAVQEAISIILDKRGQVRIADVLEKIFVTERTLERNFKSLVGLTPKQFARIIQFQCSISTINQSSIKSLVEIGFESGFSDQSHFIKTFKHYTGQTPSFYLNTITRP